MFLGRLSVAESAHLTERLVRFVMIKAVFVSAVVGSPEPAELAMWLAWCAPSLYTEKTGKSDWWSVLGDAPLR